MFIEGTLHARHYAEYFSYLIKFYLDKNIHHRLI